MPIPKRNRKYVKKSKQPSSPGIHLQVEGKQGRIVCSHNYFEGEWVGSESELTLQLRQAIVHKQIFPTPEQIQRLESEIPESPRISFAPVDVPDDDDPATDSGGFPDSWIPGHSFPRFGWV